MVWGFFPAVKASAASLDSTLFRHESTSRGLIGKFEGIQTFQSDSVYADPFLYPLQGHKRGFFYKTNIENSFYFVIPVCLD